MFDDPRWGDDPRDRDDGFRDRDRETSVRRAELTDLSGRSSVPSCHHRGPKKGVRFAVAPTLILREHWRASRLPSVPSALRGLDPRQCAPDPQRLSERRRSLFT